MHWLLGTEVIQDLMLNLNARAYHVSGRFAWGAHGGFRPSLSRSGEVKPGTRFGGDYEELHWRNWLLKAYTIGPCIRLYSKSGGGSYMELDGFYRHWRFDRKQVRYNNAEDISFDGLRSERTDVLAVRLLWGGSSEPKFKGNARSAMVIEGFGGVGYRWKTLRAVMHSGTYAGNPAYELAVNDETSTPTIHFGVRICRVFRSAKPAE